MKKRSWWLLAAPALGGCPFLCFNPHRAVPWDGRNADGTPWDGGAVEGCFEICQDAGVFSYACVPYDSTRLDCLAVNKGGRAPPGLVGLSSPGSSIGSVLAAAAEFEAASVHAFWQLAGELEAHGLPGDGAREAAYDEVRHARDTTRLALSRGWLPPLPRVMPLAEPRSLEAIAIDNAYEGCGRELLGSVINAWQAEHAGDPQVRALMREIAPDEAQHAAFSVALAETLMPRLPVAARYRVREAQHRALESAGHDGLPETVRRQLGLLDADQAKAAAQRLLDTARI